MSGSSFEVHVDVIQCENTSQVGNLCIRNESPNCVLDDMLPLFNCVDTIESLDTLNIIPGLPYSFISSGTSEKSASSSSCRVDNDYQQNSICKRLCEIRAKNINKIIVAELSINSIRNKFEQLVENINKNVDILLLVETKLDDSLSW